jgi:hypothetical protein
MRTPHFLRLALINEQRFITACRHGLVHLTWERTTIRFSRDEFRQLSSLLQRAQDDMPPAFVREGQLCITCRLDEDCELQIGPLVLLLSPAEFDSFVEGARDAVCRLDEILASGIWDREEPDEPPPNLVEHFRQVPFSQN